MPLLVEHPEIVARQVVIGALVVFLLCVAAFSSAQTREDITVYVSPATGGTAEQQGFFNENFKMEIAAAGYALKEEEAGADYTLKMEIQDNKIVYDDGSSDPDPNNPYLLTIILNRNKDNNEMVRFAYPFDTLEGMYQFNLYLVYQAMANVPLTKLTGVPDTNHWRNKWLYIRASADYNLISYQADQKRKDDNWQKDISDINSNNNRDEYVPLAQMNSQSTLTGLGGTVGLEFQYLNWMSTEVFFKILFGDTGGSTFVPTLGFEQKFPLKPSRHFMLEPYALLEFPLNTGGVGSIKKFARLAVGGGFQFGVRGGELGAFFIDVNYIYNIGEIRIVDSYRDAYWKRWVLNFGIGYKVGFFNRNKTDQ